MNPQLLQNGDEKKAKTGPDEAWRTAVVVTAPLCKTRYDQADEWCLLMVPFLRFAQLIHTVFGPNSRMVRSRSTDSRAEMLPPDGGAADAGSKVPDVWVHRVAAVCISLFVLILLAIGILVVFDPPWADNEVAIRVNANRTVAAANVTQPPAEPVKDGRAERLAGRWSEPVTAEGATERDGAVTTMDQLLATDADGEAKDGCGRQTTTPDTTGSGWGGGIYTWLFRTTIC